MHANGIFHQAFAFAFWLILLPQVASSISFSRRGNPLEGILWSLNEQASNNPLSYKRPTADHFRTFSCSERRDQLYPDLTSRCHSYYRCLGGATYSYMCPDGEKLDFDAQKCKPEEDVECLALPPSTGRCWQQPDGFYPDYDDGCVSYYSCYNASVEEEGKCEEGSIWDSATGSCGYGQHVICNPPSCLGLHDGFFPLPGSLCSAYYSCSDGFRTDMMCPYKTIFDYMKKQCVSANDAVCYERACEGRVNGLHAKPHSSCSTYYRCFNGAMVQLEECPASQIFNGRKCVTKTNFSCWKDGKGSCGDNPDGLYPSEEPDCRGFFYCKNRQMIRSFRCDHGLVFNGKHCVDAQNFICSAVPPIPDCSRKFDGYYTVDKTNCKNFYRCRASKKISQHTCPGSQLFNGYQCVGSAFFTCPSSTAINMENSVLDKGLVDAPTNARLFQK